MKIKVLKTKGFSLIEILIVMSIVALLFSYSFNTHQHSRLHTQAQLDQHYLLQLPILVENYYSENLLYPDDISDFLTINNGQYTTAKEFYLIQYSINANNEYRFIATLNPNKIGIAMIDCYQLVIESSTTLKAFNKDNKDITTTCWN